MLNKAILLACLGGAKGDECLGRFKATIEINDFGTGNIYSISNPIPVDGNFTVQSLAYVTASEYGVLITDLGLTATRIENETTGQSESLMFIQSENGFVTYAFFTDAVFEGVTSGQVCVFAVYR